MENKLVVARTKEGGVSQGSGYDHKKATGGILDCTNVSMLIMLAYFSFCRCYYWFKGYTRSLCIIS